MGKSLGPTTDSIASRQTAVGTILLLTEESLASAFPFLSSILSVITSSSIAVTPLICSTLVQRSFIDLISIYGSTSAGSTVGSAIAAMFAVVARSTATIHPPDCTLRTNYTMCNRLDDSSFSASSRMTSLTAS